MNWRHYLLLAGLGFCLSLAVAQFERFPGYLDSDYYFSGGLQLAQGRGFTEPYLWNYLDDPVGLPHPANTYWMPLSSIITAAGLWITGQASYQAGRLGFLLLAATVPLVTAALAYSFSQRRGHALVSGLLAVFSIYYSPFLPVTDNYAPYIVLGGLYFIMVGRRRDSSWLFLGLLGGLLTLARTDGLMWLGLTAILIVWRLRRHEGFGAPLFRLSLALVGFLVIMGPWFWRTYSLYGTLLAPGGGHLLWLTNYDQTFIYPASQLSMRAWLGQGWGQILAVRLDALRWNLLNAFAAQGGIFLFPFVLVGAWQQRHEERVRLGALAWLGLLFGMTVLFPLAGARGGFFHSGAALQPLWWALSPIGLEVVISAARRRNYFTPDASKIFQAALVGLAVLMTAVIIDLRVLSGWGEGEQNYPRIETFLQGNDILPGETVMVRNPPGYYLMTGRPAVVVPYGNATTIIEAAARYHAKYLVLEAAGVTGPIKTVYDDESNPMISFLGDLDGTRVFRFEP